MTDTSKKPREIWCLSNFNVTTQMPDGQVQDIRIAVKELKNSIINGEVTKLIPLSEYQSLLEQCEKLIDAVKNVIEHESMEDSHVHEHQKLVEALKALESE